jgi:hypothetical protein
MIYANYSHQEHASGEQLLECAIPGEVFCCRHHSACIHCCSVNKCGEVPCPVQGPGGGMEHREAVDHGHLGGHRVEVGEDVRKVGGALVVENTP